MAKQVYIETWGCQMNTYDSKRMLELLHTVLDYIPTEDPAAADLLIMNTCSIREKAEEKVFSCLGRWRKLKDKRPEVLLAVGGCVASQEGSVIQQRAPYVDIIFGPQTLHRLPNLILEAQTKHGLAMDISFPAIEKFDNLPTPKAEGPCALVSIQEGCNKYCKYCIVPFTRGEEVNRPLDDVLSEVMSLTEQGVREITLLGQNVNAYRGVMHNGEIATLGILIAYIAAIPTIGRIRFYTSHPTEFDDTLLQAYGEIPQLANHLHLPIQSGSDAILAAMGRGHTALEYRAKIKALRKLRPTLSLTSDFIIGYPGETEKDFADTLALVEELDFDHSFSFIYSQRPGTLAAALPDDVSLEVKKHRLYRLQQQLRLQAAQHSQRMIGTQQSILVLGVSDSDPFKLMGKTENNRTAYFRGDSSLVGQFVTIAITAAAPYTVEGELVHEPAYA